ncbi:unnamed protein product, partial [Didymodactylos carnosus]
MEKRCNSKQIVFGSICYSLCFIMTIISYIMSKQLKQQHISTLDLFTWVMVLLSYLTNFLISPYMLKDPKHPKYTRLKYLNRLLKFHAFTGLLTIQLGIITLFYRSILFGYLFALLVLFTHIPSVILLTPYAGGFKRMIISGYNCLILFGTFFQVLQI